jgi:hypothetical protein
VKVLILSLIPLGFFVLGWLAGRVRPAPSEFDRKELVALREMREDLMSMAAEHIALGDTFAPIAFDRMKETRWTK